MKLLGYCLLCLFVTRLQSKPQTTKLFPVEGLAAYQKQLSNATRPLETFFGRLRATFNFVFRQPDNTSLVERILGRVTPSSDPQPLRIVWADTTRTDNYTNLKYPNNTLFDQVKSVLQSRKMNSSSNLGSDLTAKSTIKINATKQASRASSSEKTLLDDDNWFNDIEPLSRLELQDEPGDKNEVEIVTTRPILSTTLGSHLAEWLESFIGLSSSIYAKLTSAVCGKRAAPSALMNL